MFTVEVKVNGQLIFSRSCNRIAGDMNGPCLYVSDDGQFIEHHYDHGAAILAARLLANVTNILKAEHIHKIRKWEKCNMKRALDEIPTENGRPKKRKRRR